jgi:hypothetical protein
MTDVELKMIIDKLTFLKQESDMLYKENQSLKERVRELSIVVSFLENKDKLDKE